jgi:hypothetical protein
MPTGKYRMRKSLRPYVRKDIPMTFSPDTKLKNETAGGIRFDLMHPEVYRDAKKVEKGIERSYRLLQKGTAKSEMQRLQSKGKVANIYLKIEGNPDISDKRKARLKKRALKIQKRGIRRSARAKHRLYKRAGKIYQRSIEGQRGAVASLGNLGKQQFDAFGSMATHYRKTSDPYGKEKDKNKMSGYDLLKAYRSGK